MKTLFDYKGLLQEKLAKHPEVIFALLYGSASEGPDFRDLDVGIFVDRKQVPSEKDLDYCLDMADDFSLALDFPVDVRVVNDASLGFRYSVSIGEVLIANDEEALADFREHTWDLWFDFEPVVRKYLRELI